LNAAGLFRTGIVNAPLTGLVVADMAAGDPVSHPVEAFLMARFQNGTQVVAGDATPMRQHGMASAK